MHLLYQAFEVFALKRKARHIGRRSYHYYCDYLCASRLNNLLQIDWHSDTVSTRNNHDFHCFFLRLTNDLLRSLALLLIGVLSLFPVVKLVPDK